MSPEDQYVAVLIRLRDLVKALKSDQEVEKILGVGSGFLRNRWSPRKDPSRPGRTDLTLQELLRILAILEIDPCDFLEKTLRPEESEDPLKKLMRWADSLPGEDEALTYLVEQRRQQR